MDLNIKMKHWNWECGDGCCTMYGIETYINDVLVCESSNTYSIIESILKHLDYNVTVEEVYGCDPS